VSDTLYSERLLHTHFSHTQNSSYRHRIEGEAEKFQDISTLLPADAAKLIHSDGIDILINLNGYTKGARNEIFALKPAPLQVF
jgi:protein O-GlcNAc transferase